MPSIANLSMNRVINGQHEATIESIYRPVAKKTGILFCHGAGGTGEQALTAQFAPMLYALSDAGYPVLSHQLVSSGTWGNDASMQAVSTARNYLVSQMGAKPGKVFLIGASMGGLTALTWALQNPQLVAGIVGLVPVSDVNDMVVNNRQGLAAAINAAFSGGWSQAVYGPTRNPITFAGNLINIPSKLYAAASDTTVIPSTVSQMATGMGSATTFDTLTGAHDTFVPPVAAIKTFIDANQT